MRMCVTQTPITKLLNIRSDNVLKWLAHSSLPKTTHVVWVFDDLLFVHHVCVSPEDRYSTSVEFCTCVSVFANTVRVFHPLLVFPWPVDDYMSHNSPKLRTEEFFLWLHVGQPMCWCVQRAWSDSVSTTHCTAAAKRCTCQLFRTQVVAYTRCPATLSSWSSFPWASSTSFLCLHRLNASWEG